MGKESQTQKKHTKRATHSESHSSPLCSPIPSDAGDPQESPAYHSPAGSPQITPPRPVESNNSRAIVAVDKFNGNQASSRQTPLTSDTEKSPSSMVVYNRWVREEGQPATTTTTTKVGGGESAVTRRITKRAGSVRMAALGFRLSEIVLTLISFSVMAADRTQGWSGDSFDRYKEYRYCLSVNIIAFAYSGFQACDLAYYMVRDKSVVNHHLRFTFDFFMDQVLAYLLISAASSAATRVDDWVSNWGKDEFTEMATASVAMAFLAFLAFALSSLISGYRLCTGQDG